MNKLLDEINLSSIELSGNGQAVTLEFLDMNEGRLCARLIAEGVVALNYHNVFLPAEDGLPVYIGEVTGQPLSAKECERILLRLGYGFLGRGSATFLPETPCSLIHVEGGEVTVDIVCSHYRLLPQEQAVH